MYSGSGYLLPVCWQASDTFFICIFILFYFFLFFPVIYRAVCVGRGWGVGIKGTCLRESSLFLFHNIFYIMRSFDVLMCYYYGSFTFSYSVCLV